MEQMKKLKQNLLATSLLLGAVTYGGVTPAMAQQRQNQKVTIVSKSMTVKQFFAEVKKQTGLNFIYSTDLAAKLPHITVNATNRPLRQVLDEVMNKVNCRYEIEGNIVTITRRMAGERVRNVSGVVTDESGDPLIGVSVCIDDSKVCTITDSKGFYTLKVPANACTLKFSYLGMSNAEVHLGNGRNPLSRSIQMSTDHELSEVVVTGYQEISKPKMTGSVTTITSSKLDERYTTNIMNNLEGRVAGLSTYNGKMTIRGTSSLFAETTPLLVVDGVPVEGSIEDLNPYDIESVNVLKDAAANAIYGARASNGVIVVTTKNAKKAGKIDIDFAANLTIYEKKNVDYADNFYMTPAQQVDTEANYWDYYFFHNDGEVTDPIKDAEQAIAQGTQAVTPIQYAYLQRAKGEISEEELQSQLASLKKNNYAKDYANAVYKQRVMQQYNLSLRGRSDKFTNNLTLNYKYDNSGLINHFANQFNAQYKGSYEVAKWLTASFTLNGIYSKQREAGYDYNGSYANIWAQPAYMPFYNADGSVKGQHYWYDGDDYMTFDSPFEDLSSNPVDEYYKNTQTTRRQYMRYHGDLLFKIIDGLTANAQFVYESNRNTVDWMASQDSHVMRTMRNAYYYQTADGTIKNYVPTTGGMLRTTNTNGRYWTARGQLNYSKTFGKHDIMAIAGLEFRETKQTGSKALLLGYDDQLQTSSTHTIDFATLSTMNYAPYFFGASGGYPASQFVFNPYIKEGMGIVTEQHHKYASGYFNLTYTYDEKYNVFASFRKDYADVYGLNAKFRGTPLWSVGAGWLIHNEDFMKDIKWINFLKLRASYGVTGNIYQGATSYMTASSGSLNSLTNLPYGTIESPANPNLKWEQSRTTNIGIDFGLLDNRLRGSIDYYNKVGKDIFSNRTLDPTTGFTSMFVNMASMRNRGIELQVTYDWFRAATRKGWSWTTNFTMSHNKNVITSVENPSTRAYQLTDNPYVEGYPSSALWSYRFAGISDQKGEKGQTLWYIEDGGKSHNASSKSTSIMEYSGQSEPKVIMGMDNSVRWNGFSFSILMAYYGGHMMRALAETETFGVPATAINSYFLNAWTPENPTNTPGIGRYASTAVGSEPGYSDISIHHADFLKIRNIVFGYDFPQQWIKHLGMNRLTLRFQIDNPKYLWVANSVHVDPETLGLRNPSSFIFGLNVNF
nr:SusC/RagA family TonB-linked outer membrane protein [Prevotella sp.]